MESTLITIYWTLAIAGSVIFVVRLGLMLVGLGEGDADFDGDADSGGGGDSDSAFAWLSVQGLSVLSLGVGWTGLLAQLTWGLPTGLASIVALGAGGVLTWTVLRLMRLMFRLEQSGTLNLDDAVGASGTVYLTIPEGGIGQVQVNVEGRFLTLDATAGARTLATGQAITVDAVDTRGVLFVSPAWSPL